MRAAPARRATSRSSRLRNLPCAPEFTTSVRPTAIGAGSAVVGMPAQDHVEAAHAAGHLHVGRQPVVAQEHDDVDLLDVAQLVDEPLRLRLPDAEREVRARSARGCETGM